MASMREDQLLGDKIAELIGFEFDGGSPQQPTFKTTEGPKTAVGIGVAIRRLIEEAKTEKFTSTTYVEE